MGVIRARLRAERRTRWRAWLVIALVAGIGAGVVAGLAAGARRTERAYPEFVDQQRAADVIVAGQSAFGLIGSVKLDDVEKLPEVRETARASVTVLFAGRTGDGRRIGPVDLFPVASADEKLGTSVERWHIEEGRRANPDVVDEATASFFLAERLDLHVGDTVRLRFVQAASFTRVAATLLGEFGPRLAGDPDAVASSIEKLADGADVTFRIVGIEASPAEFPPLGVDLSPVLHLTPAFSKAHSADVAATSELSFVRLEQLSFLPAFERGVERLAPGQPAGFIGRRDGQTVKVQRSVHVQAIALWIVAGLVLLALVFVLAQSLVREMLALSPEDGVLTALGVTRRGLVALAAARGAVIGVLASIITVVVATAISPLMPIGIARRADLHPGISFDVLTIIAGAVVTALAASLLAAAAGWRTAALRRAPQHTTARSRRPMVDRVLDGVQLPQPSAIGVRFALDRGGTAGVPVWTAVLGAMLALSMLAGVWSFQAGLDRLLGTPHLYGWNWDAKVGAPALPNIGGVMIPALEGDPDVASIAAGTMAQARLGGHRIDVLAVDQERGTLGPTVLEGRLPRAPDEIVLGTTTLEQIDARVGSSITLGIGDRGVPMRVVGRAVFPALGDSAQLGDGGFTTYEALLRVLPSAQQNLFLVTYKSAVGVDGANDRTRGAVDPIPVRVSGRPGDLEDLAEVDGLPTVLASLLVLLAATTLAHTLVSSVRRRRRDLAVLKAMGFRRRQVVLTVVSQTTTLVLIAVALGLPIGVGLGVWAWIAFADGLGVPADATVPLLSLLLAVPAALLFGNAIAAIPAWIAGRTRPAVALREE